MSSATMDIPIDQLRRLPVEKRLRLIDELWESVENETGLPATSEAIADELDRRHAEHVANPSTSLSWEVVRAEMRRHLE